MTDLKKVADDVRDIINWIAVFENEYDLPKDVVDQLRKRLQKVAKDVANL